VTGLLAFATFASAGVPVLHDGADVAAITEGVAARTGLPASQLDPVALDTLLATPPQVLGAASLRRCAREPSAPSAVEAEFGRAEAAYSASDDGAAMDHLDLALALAGCLPSIVEPAILARVFLLRGAVASEQGDVATASHELRSAVALVPDVAWPMGWGPEGAALLAAEQADLSTYSLSVVPPPATSGPWIDGRAVASTQPLGAGLHLAQYAGTSGIRSAWLTVGGDARFVLPGSFRRPVLELMVDPAGRAAVEALLEATIPEFQAAYVAHGGGLWLVTREPAGLVTAELVPIVPPAPELPVSTPRKKR
jgi:hypothetical protein